MFDCIVFSLFYFLTFYIFNCSEKNNKDVANLVLFNMANVLDAWIHMQMTQLVIELLMAGQVMGSINHIAIHV